MEKCSTQTRIGHPNGVSHQSLGFEGPVGLLGASGQTGFGGKRLAAMKAVMMGLRVASVKHVASSRCQESMKYMTHCPIYASSLAHWHVYCL